MRELFAALWVVLGFGLFAWRPGWPTALLAVFMVAGWLFNEWMGRALQAQRIYERLDKEKAEHRAELERLHANLKQVADKVVSLGNQAAFRPLGK